MTSSDVDARSSQSPDFALGEWNVIPARNLISREDGQVRLEPRVMDVLVYLAQRAGQPVSKDELTERVWKREYASDDIVSVTIHALRKALGDDARQPRYIETIPRRGYRLIAPVHFAPPAFERVGSHTPAEAEAHGARHRKPAVAAVTVAVLALGAIALLRNEPHVRHVPTAEAHEAYTKGRYFLDQRSIEGWRNALENFERAIALDPDDPASHAGLADTYTAMSDFGVASPAEMRPRAMTAARRALELDPRSAEGHEALGRAQFLFDWDFAAAERSFTRALELNPDYMPAHQAMAWLKSALARHDEAATSAKMALRLDPVNTARYTELAGVFTLGGRYDEALHEIGRALQLSPRSFESHLMKGWIYELSGKPDSAFVTYRQGLRIVNVPDAMLTALDSAYRAAGLRGFYRAWLARRGGGAPLSHTFQAQIYSRAGQLDSALHSLERAYEKHEGALAWVNVEPTFRPLRSDARFQRIAAAVTRRD